MLPVLQRLGDAYRFSFLDNYIFYGCGRGWRQNINIILPYYITANSNILLYVSINLVL